MHESAPTYQGHQREHEEEPDPLGHDAVRDACEHHPWAARVCIYSLGVQSLVQRLVQRIKRVFRRPIRISAVSMRTREGMSRTFIGMAEE